MKISTQIPLKKGATALSGALIATVLSFSSVVHAVEDLEKEDLKFGFIKLTDMAPLAIAYEKGYFEDEGLYVKVEAQANWKVLLDRVINGELDGAHMLAGQPLGATIGFGTKADIITAFSMDLNGNAITVSNDIWSQMKAHVPMEGGKPVHPIKASSLKPVVDKYNIVVTHDVDEAILLADRVVMMSNGPNAKVGKIEEIDLPRPRTRKNLLAHPDYYKYRESLLTFLAECDKAH